MDNRHGEMDTYSGRNLAPRPYMYNSESEDSSEELVIVNTPTKQKTEEPSMPWPDPRLNKADSSPLVPN